MMGILNSFLIGNWGDQIGVIWLSWWYQNYSLFSTNPNFTPLLGPTGATLDLTTPQYLVWFVYFHLSRLVGLNAAYNLIILIGLLLSITISYKLFKKFFSISTSIFLSLCFSITTYFIEHSKEHMDLAQVWIIPLSILLYEKVLEKKHYKWDIVGGLTLGLLTLWSNYYGFFNLITLCSYILYFLILFIFSKTRKNHFVPMMHMLVMLFTFIISIFVFLFPYINSNFISKPHDVLSSNLVIARDYSDFFTFSARPWYFIIPSVKNPLFGNFSETILSKGLDTGYFLFDNYFSGEHGSAFLGWIPLLLFGLSILLFNKMEKGLVKFYFIVFCLFLFSLPPFITIAGVRLFTPGEVIAQYLPMFRTTVRLSVFILAFILLGAGYYLEYIKSKMPTRIYQTLLILFFIFNFSQMFIPLKFLDVSTPPEIYTYIYSKTPDNSKFVFYPETSKEENLYWMQVYKRVFINADIFTNLPSDDPLFESSLASSHGIDQAKGLGADYIVVFKSAQVKDIETFKHNSSLELEKEFSDSIIFKLN